MNLSKSGNIVIISDLHVGHPNVDHEKIFDFLNKLDPKVNLILAGDILDLDRNFNQLNEKMIEFLLLLQKFKSGKIIWILGNHDEHLFYALKKRMHLIKKNWSIRKNGTEVKIQFGKKKIIIVHGDQFDPFFQNFHMLYDFFIYISAWTSWLQDWFKIKRNTNFMFSEDKFMYDFYFYPQEKKLKRKYISHRMSYDWDQHKILIFGHTHNAYQENNAINLGDWINDSRYCELDIKSKEILLKKFIKE